MPRLNIESGVWKHFSSMSLLHRVLIGVSLVMLLFSVPIDIMRHVYMWTAVLQGDEDAVDPYRRLIGHCECFLRDEQGRLPSCVRAYSTVWTAPTLIQIFIFSLLLLTRGGSSPAVLSMLAGAYAAVIIVLLMLFTDCGVLTEDDCYIMYLLLPNIVYAAVLMMYTFRASSTPRHTQHASYL